MNLGKLSEDTHLPRDKVRIPLPMKAFLLKTDDNFSTSLICQDVTQLSTNIQGTLDIQAWGEKVLTLSVLMFMWEKRDG